MRIHAEAGRAATARAFDPSSLSLSGWWRGPFGGSPWVATASAGGSGSRNLAEATDPPAIGTAANAYASADFDGTNDQLTSAVTIADYYTASAYSGFALVNVDAINTDSDVLYANDGIVCATAGYTGISIQSTGPAVGLFHYDTDYRYAAATIATGGWHLVQWVFGSGAIKIRVDSGAWSSPTSAGDLHATGLIQTLRAGRNYDVAYFDGKILEVGLAASALPDATFDAIKNYVNARYALAL